MSFGSACSSEFSEFMIQYDIARFGMVSHGMLLESPYDILLFAKNLVTVTVTRALGEDDLAGPWHHNVAIAFLG